MTQFPTNLDTLTNPASTDAMNSITVPHADQHSNANDAIEALQAKVGVDESGVTTSLDYLMSSSTNPGHVHSNLVSGTIAVRAGGDGTVIFPYYSGVNQVLFTGTSGLIQQTQNLTYVGSSFIAPILSGGSFTVASGTVLGNLTVRGPTATVLMPDASSTAGGYSAGGDALWYRGGADIWQTPDSVRVDTRLSIGTPISTTVSCDNQKIITEGSWLNERNLLTVNQNLSGGQSVGNVSNVLYLNAGLNSGPSNFGTSETAATVVQAGTAYVHYAVGGEFSAKTAAGRTGGITNLFVGGLFQAWLQSNPGGEFTTAYGGRFDMLSIDSSTSGSVTTGVAGVFRYGGFVAGSKTSFSTLTGAQLSPLVASGTITTLYGLLGDNMVNNASGLVTTSKWIQLGSQVPIRANNQVRVGIEIAAMPASDAFTGTWSTAVQLASGNEQDSVTWGRHTRAFSPFASSLRIQGELNTTRRIVSNVFTLTDSASITVNAALANHFRVVLGGNRSLTRPVSAYDTQKMTFEFKQDGTGNRVLTLDQSFRFGSDITSVTLSTSGQKLDFMTCIYTEAISAFAVVGFVKGY